MLNSKAKMAVLMGRIVGKANRVLLSFDKNHHYVPRLGKTFSSLD